MANKFVPYYEEKDITIYCEDVMAILRDMPEESVDCVITSPPYWALRDYGIEPQIWDGNPKCEHDWESKTYRIGNRAGNTDKDTNPFFLERKNIGEQFKSTNPTSDFCSKCNAWRGSLGLEPTFQLYLQHLLQIFDEIKRVLKKTGTCFVNLGDSYGGKSATGQANKPKINPEQYNQWKRSSVLRQSLQDKCLIQIPYRFSIAMTDRGWILRNIILWHKPNCMPSSVKDRFTVDYEPIFFFSKNKKYWFEMQYEPLNWDTMRRSKARHSGKKAKKLPPAGLSNEGSIRYTERLHSGQIPQGRNRRCVWKIPTQPYKEAHFATFPEKLVEPMILSGCPKEVCIECGKGREKIYEKTSIPTRPAHIKNTGKSGQDNDPNKQLHTRDPERHIVTDVKTLGYTDCGCNAGWASGIVLDPFAGSMTVGVVAKQLNRRFRGIDIKPEYCDMGIKRIQNTQRDMFLS